MAISNRISPTISQASQAVGRAYDNSTGPGSNVGKQLPPPGGFPGGDQFGKVLPDPGATRNYLPVDPIPGRGNPGGVGSGDTLPVEPIPGRGNPGGPYPGPYRPTPAPGDGNLIPLPHINPSPGDGNLIPLPHINPSPPPAPAPMPPGQTSPYQPAWARYQLGHEQAGQSQWQPPGIADGRWPPFSPPHSVPNWPVGSGSGPTPGEDMQQKYQISEQARQLRDQLAKQQSGFDPATQAIQNIYARYQG